MTCGGSEVDGDGDQKRGVGLVSKKHDFSSRLTQKDNSGAALAIEERDPLFESELPF